MPAKTSNFSDESAKGDDSSQAADQIGDPIDGERPPQLPFTVVGIGASAGGLEALTRFFKTMPGNTGMSFVIVQHLPPDRESLMAEILAKRTVMPVLEVEDNLAVEANKVYFIRPGRTLRIEGGKLHLSEPLEKPGHRRPVDDFFRSLAEEQRERAVAIILSGMGSNGTAGAQSVKAVGGMTIAQDPETTDFPSMPRNLINSGLADFALAPEEMSDVLIRYANHPYAVGIVSAATLAQRERRALTEILATLRTRTRHDFTGYKKGTIVRRVQRRMGLGHVEKMSDYARNLRQRPSEVTDLADDLMIHVTGFFRDGFVWESLKNNVIVPMVKQRENDSEIRAWITACSSGEEAYSLAILFVEAAEEANKHFDIKIFATDTAERSLSHARGGLFAGGIESEVSAERLERFFDREDALYRVKKELRSLVVFAPQNVLQDPPFSRIDICTCRNLLIYLEPDMQQRVLALIHFGLAEGGTLMLGNSETVSGSEELFLPIDKKARLYRRVGPTRHGAVNFPLNRLTGVLPNGEQRRPQSVPRPSVLQMTNQLLLEQYTPPAVVIDRHQQIVFFHGNTSPYLDQPRGEPTRDLIALARDPVRGLIRHAIEQAFTTDHTTTMRDGVIETSYGRRRLEITVMPMGARIVPRPPPEHFLVSFVEKPVPAPQPSEANGGDVETNVHLTEELQRARDELQSAIEELQSSNEEMKASNEEAMSVNEELQSTNEELETSKEELQSLNEELTTVNAQLQAKMEELAGTTNDLSSLLSSTDIGVIFLDTRYRIRRFTPAVRDLVELIPADIGRPLQDFNRKFTDPSLLGDATMVLEKLVPIEKEIVSDAMRVYVRRILPYRTSDNRIDGVVVTFFEITERRRAQDSLLESERRFRAMADLVPDLLWQNDPDGHAVWFNQRWTDYTGQRREQALGIGWLSAVHPDDRQRSISSFHAALASGEPYRHEHRLKDVHDGYHWFLVQALPIRDAHGKIIHWFGAKTDIHEQRLMLEATRNAKDSAESANAAKDRFLAMVSHELRTPLAAMLLWTKLLEESGLTDPQQVHDGLDAIRRSAESQKELIEDLLDTSRIAEGKLRLELKPTDLTSTVRSALDAIAPAIQAKGLNLSSEFDPQTGTVIADPQRLQQIVWNLLSNAVKFTPGGGTVSLSMHRLDGKVEIRVVDSGIGIEPRFLPHVFDRFQQALNSPSRTSGGLGLGLAISKQLVELHRGTISVHSEGEGRGATFSVLLPVQSREEGNAVIAQSLATPYEFKQLKGLHVLLVEDDDNTRDALTRVLKQVDITVTAVATLEAAIEAYEAQPPSLIVSDISLGTSDGFSLIRKIRELECVHNRPPIPAIALTAFPLTDDQKQLESGFQRHLSKPVEARELLEAMAGVR